MKKPRVKHSKDIAQHIDPSKKVRVYRNLHKKCFSVKQDGLVRCHVDNVVLEDCKFIVSKAGQKRVRDEGKKNVHAFVEGFVVDARATDHVYSDTPWDELYYNPYECDGFMNNRSERIAEFAGYADMDKDDRVILAYNVSYLSEVYV